MKILLLLSLVGVCALRPASAAEPPAAPMLRIEAGMHSAMIRRMGVDEAGRLALTASDDKTARLWELPSGRLLRVLRPPIGAGNEGNLYACALSLDGSVAAVGGWTGVNGEKDCIYLFDTATGRLLHRLSGLPDVTFDLAFSAQGRFLAAVLGGGKGLRVWETKTGAEVGRDANYGEHDSNGVDWHGEERLVTTSFDGSLRLYQMGTASRPASSKGSGNGQVKLLAKAVARGGKEAFSVRFSPDGARIAVGFQDSTKVAVHDGKDLGFLFAPDTAAVDDGDLSKVTWSRDGSTLAAGGAWTSKDDQCAIRLWPQAGKGQPRDVIASSSTLMDLRPLPGGGILFGAQDPVWGVLGAAGELARLGASPLADTRNLPERFQLSANGALVAFSYEAAGKSPARFSVAARELSAAGPGVEKETLAPARITGLSVTDWQNAPAPKIAGKTLLLHANEYSQSLAITRDASGFLLGSDWHLRRYTSKGAERWKVPAPGAAWSVNLADNDRLAVAAYGDGTIRWHRADSGKELLAFFPHADRKRWVLWTPQGYYDASPGAEELIGWHVNRGKDQEADFFSAAKFRDQFYRPDVIQEVLARGDVNAALKAANDAAGRKAQTVVRSEDVVVKMQPPVVELTVGGARGEATVPADAASFTVRYRVRRGGGEPVTRVRLLVDGRPVPADGAVPANDKTDTSAAVPLPARDCIVSVIAENRFAVSEPATLRLVRAGAAPAPAPQSQPTALKPKLYVLSAGIAIYKNNDQLDNLQFAAKDAQDFAAAFRRQEGGLYQKVEAKVLTDKDATAADIRDGLDWIKQQTTVKDVAVIFLSGHGENDEELRYFFCAHDYDKSRRLRTGVSIGDIQATLRSIPGKVLFFIDSCHAGNALGKLYAAKGAGSQVDVTRLVNELAGAENGAIVFTSSTGRQLSLELAEGNGAFTKAIVEGIDGRADLLRNGKVTVATLEAFLAERVKELTEGRQSPTVAKPQTVPDYTIAVKR